MVHNEYLINVIFPFFHVTILRVIWVWHTNVVPYACPGFCFCTRCTFTTSDCVETSESLQVLLKQMPVSR